MTKSDTWQKNDKRQKHRINHHRFSVSVTAPVAQMQPEIIIFDATLNAN